MSSPEQMADSYTLRRKAAAWSVHAFTALGLPLAFLAAAALATGNAALCFVALWLASAIDSVDGTLARRVRVKEVLPNFNGAKLDDIVDFLNFVFLPALALPALGILPPGWELWALAPLVASGYGFCQGNAKTDDSFVGFPSYWNVLVLYLYVYDARPATAAAFLGVLSLLVFVPIHYLYPSRTRFLRKVTIPVTLVWSFALLPLVLYPDAPWAARLATLTMIGPAYYLLASLVHHQRLHQA